MAKSDFLSRTRLFLEVLNEESLNQAAESLGKSTPQVSREIAKLEQELHVKLFTRLPTGIRVTREGAKFAEQILPLIERFDTLEESLIRETDQEINLFLPITEGTELFQKWIARFAEANPDVRVNSRIRDPNAGQNGGYFNYQVVLEREPADDTLVAVRICSVPLVCVAAPAYLAKAGTPESPEDLLRHLIRVSSREMELPVTLHETGTGRSYTVPTGHAGDSGLVLALKNRVLEGGGIGIAVPRYLVESELETGDLIEVLPDWQIEPEVMWLLRPQSRFPSDAAAFAFNEAVTPHAAEFGMSIPSLGVLAAFAGAFGRQASPLCGGLILVAGIAGVNPMDIVRRTAPVMVILLVCLYIVS